MRTRLISLTLALLWAVGASAGTSSEDARAWIKRMNAALTNLNYHGVLTHRSKGGSDALSIIHRMSDGHMVERVISLNGSGYENIRDGVRFIEFFPAKPGAKRIALVQTRNRSYGYIQALNGVNEGSEKFYVISTVGAQELLGWPKPTQFVSVEPRDAQRYGYRLWLDPESAMPIRTQLVTKAGEVIDEITFSSLRLVPTIADGMLKPSVNMNNVQWKKPADMNQEAVTQAFVPIADQLPAGFRVLDTGLPNPVQAAGPKTRFIVTDGVSWVSVVITVAGNAPEGFEGFGQPVGAAATYVIRRNGYYISVMGEAPPATVKAIAGSVRPE